MECGLRRILFTRCLIEINRLVRLEYQRAGGIVLHVDDQLVARPHMQRGLFLALRRGEAKLFETRRQWRWNRIGLRIEPRNARVHRAVVVESDFQHTIVSEQICHLRYRTAGLKTGTRICSLPRSCASECTTEKSTQHHCGTQNAQK